jgi:DNA-binding NarL/FixJ family response regulator
VALGLSNKQIAATLDISVRTVENHMRSIFEKLGVTTRTRLAAKFYEATGRGASASHR